MERLKVYRIGFEGYSFVLDLIAKDAKDAIERTKLHYSTMEDYKQMHERISSVILHSNPVVVKLPEKTVEDIVYID